MNARPSATRPIRVLVVEDSTLMRGIIRDALAADPEIEVVGAVGDGAEALRAVDALAPDVVTMDVVMPRSDGLEAVARIMSERPTPIVMLSAHTRTGSAAAIRALELGAVDVVAKPAAELGLGVGALRRELVKKVRLAARIRAVRTATRAAAPRPCEHREVVAGRGAWTPCVVIAASTGGPAALLATVPALPATLPASVLIVQHMPAPCTSAFARELGARAALPVREAADGDRLRAGTVYVCPGARQATVDGRGRLQVRAPDAPAVECPSADVVMTAVARHAGAAAIGVVLTGMGRDGAAGARAIRAAGGLVLAQDEASSVVFGMPRAAIEQGSVDAVVAIDDLVPTLCAFVEERAAVRGRTARTVATRGVVGAPASLGMRTVRGNA